MDKTKRMPIIIGIIVIGLAIYIGLIVAENMNQSISSAQNFCKDITPETYNITKNHELCIYNETTGKYDLNITLINEVIT